MDLIGISQSAYSILIPKIVIVSCLKGGMKIFKRTAILEILTLLFSLQMLWCNLNIVESEVNLSKFKPVPFINIHSVYNFFIKIGLSQFYLQCVLLE